MAKTFRGTKGILGDRLVAALVAGGKAGGDRRGEESVALLVVKKGAGYEGMDNYIDISIYDHPRPLEELERVYRLHKLYFFKSDPKNLVAVTPDLCREMQTIMEDRGFYKGEVNGIYDAATRKSLTDFMYWENYDIRVRTDSLIDTEVLVDIRKNYAEWKSHH